MSVCPSVASRYCIETAEPIEELIVSGLQTIVGLSYVFIFKNNVSPLEFCHRLWTQKKFRYSTSTIASVVNLVRPTTVAGLSH